MKKTKINYIQVILLAVLGVVLSFFIEGYQYGKGDMSHYLVFLNNLSNPDLYPNDILVSSLPFHYSYFWHGVEILSSKATQSWFLFCLYFIISLAIALFFLIFGYQLSKNKTIAIIFLFFFITPWRHPGGFSLGIGSQEMTQSEFALPFLLFSLYAFIKGRYALAVFLSVLMFHIQGQMAFYFIFIYGFAILIDLKQLRLKTLLKISAAFILGSSPIFLNFSSFINKNINADQFELYWQIASKRLSANLTALGGLNYKWVPLFFIMVLGIIGFFIKEKHTIEDKRLLRLIPGTMFLISLHFLLVEFFPVHPFFLKLMPLRSAMVLILIFSFYSAYTTKDLIQKENIVALLCGLILLMILVFDRVFSPLLILPLLCFVFLFYRYKKFFYLIKFNLKVSNTIIILILLCGVSIYGIKNIRTGNLNCPITPPMDKNWKDVQIWAKNHTPIDSLFITPYYKKGFRVLSLRSTYVEYKDGAPLFFSQKLLLEWWKRLNYLGIDEIEDLSIQNDLLYKQNSIENFEKIASKYGANYLIVPSSMKMDKKPLYFNGDYSVYKIGVN